jgi:molecular chaperone HscC
MIVGIDLGTTNSLIAVWKDGTPQLVPNALGKNLTPSAVSLDADGQILVGMPARERLITHPDRSAAVFKRYMGSNKTLHLGGRIFRPEELSSFVLRSLKADAEAFLGEPVTEAIVTVPAYFNDAQRKATRAAGQLAGLTVERLLNEPTAAALAYGLHDAHKESKFLVFDLGGGTFDVSILELFEGVMEVRATAGDNFLGGEDFVEIMIERFIERAGKPAGLTSKHQSPRLYQQLRDQAERAKRKLTQEESATMQLQHNGSELSWTISAEEFASLSKPLLQRLRTPVERALRDARIRSQELDAVVVAGGATRMPLVRSLVARMFGRLPNVHLNPDEVVAMGAAVQAGLKMRDAALNEVVMTDVCPYTLGIEVVQRVGEREHFIDGQFLPIIERNTVVPASRTKTVSTAADHQKEVKVSIYQGEGRLVKDNILLGQIHMPVPPRRAGEISLDVRFTYDVNGIVEVEAKVQETGEHKRLVIEENPGVLTAEEIEERLRELAAYKIHPRDQAENRAMLARADRLYEQLLGQAREFLGQQITVFTSILERQDPQPIKQARIDLGRLLDQIESDSYL